MARMGDWRDNKDVEIPLDGIGGVNILVKADVHRAGAHEPYSRFRLSISLTCFQASTFPATRLRIKPKQKALRRWPNERGMESMASRIMLYGILIQKRSLVMHDDQERGLEGEEEEEGGREGYHPILPYLPVLMKMSFICAPTSLIGKLVPSRHLDMSFAADTVVCTWTCESTNQHGVFGILRRKLTLPFSFSS